MYIHCINVCMYKYSSRCNKKKPKQKKTPKAIEHIMVKALFQPRSRQCIEKSERVIAMHICGTIWGGNLITNLQ